MYSTNEAAKLLGISRVTIFNWIKSGRIASTQVGRSYLISEEAIDHEKKLRALSEYDRSEIRQFANLMLKEYGTLLETIASHA